MEKSIIDLRSDLLSEHFEPTDVGRVLEWLIAAENRRPVVLVGAGFSRNAAHKYRGGPARSEEVPLWGDVVRRMADNLRVDVGRYDAPTMAEMYVAAFGSAELRDLLRSMLMDDVLVPSLAHRALGAYRLQAVITTNFLDTLLDRIPFGESEPWKRVVTDADLSAGSKTDEVAADLIYFHGHRSASSSWVTTRSQYEDLPRRNPVIVARARQLMAQHPLLIVGYSLADPDFHNLYRQLGSEMTGHQPLGLSIHLSEVPEAERRHWDRLGIRVVAAKNGDSLRASGSGSDRFFAWLIRHVATTWSPAQDVVLEHVRRTNDPATRFARFRDLMKQPWERPSGSDHYDELSNRFAAWRDTLLSFLDNDDKGFARGRAELGRLANLRKTTLASSVAEGSSSAEGNPKARALPDDETVSMPTLQALPSWRKFEPSDENTWQLDRVLWKLRQSSCVAEHFVLALEQGLFRSDNGERGFIPWIPLTFWVAVRDKLAQERLATIARMCMSAAEKYGDNEWADLVAKEAAEAAVEVAMDQARPAEPQRPQTVAFGAMLDANFDLAAAEYGKAAAWARDERLLFDEWIWRMGQLQALNGVTSAFRRLAREAEAAEPDVDELRQACRERLAQLRRSNVVDSWLRRAQSRIMEAQAYALKRRDDRSWYRAVGGSGFSSSSALHNAWRSFRDLEVADAPPLLQAEYLEPLLLEQGFSNATELKYRMLFEPKGTKEWLHRVLHAPCASSAKQRERDAELMDTFIETTGNVASSSLRVGQLLALPAMAHAFRVSDISTIFSWLETAATSLGAQAETYKSHRFLDTDYSAVLRRFGDFMTCTQARSIWDRWRRQPPGLSAREAARCLAAFPWTVWAHDAPGEVAAWIADRAKQGRDTAEEPGAGDMPSPIALTWGDDTAIFAVYGMAATLEMAHPGALTSELKEDLRVLIEQIRHAPPAGGTSWEAKRGGFLLERLIGEPNADDSTLFDQWTTTEGWTDAAAKERIELQWSIVADAFDDERHEGSLNPIMLERVTALWRQVQDAPAWERFERRYRLNPHMCAPPARFLATCLKVLPESREVAAGRMLQLIAAAPGQLDEIAGVLEPAFWGDAWPRLVSQVLTSAGGGGGLTVETAAYEDSSGSGTAHTIGAMELLTAHVRRARRRQSAWPPPDSTEPLLVALLGTAMSAISDERTLLANHAAFAVVRAAEVVEREDLVPLVVAAMDRIQGDTRVIVRMAAVYGAERLRVLARDSRIRECISSTFDDDPNALVQRQRILGRIDLERATRNRGDLLSG